MTKLLTQDEVAVILKCKSGKVAKLRKFGQLAYLPGRPVKIEEKELQRYLDDERARKQKPKLSQAEATALLQEAARVWARNAVLTDLIRKRARAERKGLIK
jgi:hypothetical protein